MMKRANLRMGLKPIPASAIATPDYAGKNVTLSLKFADGRMRELTGKLLSVGCGGGVMDTECWPTSFLHSEVTAIRVNP
jgi:hypothetical protein